MDILNRKLVVHYGDTRSSLSKEDRELGPRPGHAKTEWSEIPIFGLLLLWADII